MKRIFLLSAITVIAITSCKKSTGDIKPQTSNAPTSQAVAATTTPVPLTAKFTYMVQDPTNIFENQSIKFNNLSTGASTWVWEFGNATKSHDLQPTISYPWHGYYTVTLTVWDDKGNKQSYSQDISILCLFANGIHPPTGANG